MNEASDSEKNDPPTSASLIASNIARLREAIGRVLFHDKAVIDEVDPIIVAIKGGWGEGKTYFWKNTVVPDHPAASPGYVSVFGADSLTDIRNKVVVQAATNHKKLKELIDEERVKKHGWISGPVAAFAKLYASLKGVPALPGGLVSGVMENFVFEKGWVLCIDDVERVSSSVDFEAFLGFVNSLRDDRNINVVLIYNEDKVTTDDKKKKAFAKYLEKVVDREFSFQPDIAEVLQFVFGEDLTKDEDLLKEIIRRCDVLGLRNIRILKRVRAYLDDLREALPGDADPDFASSGFYSLLLFCWVKFARDDAAEYRITFEYLQEQFYYSEAMLAFIEEKGAEDDAEEKKRTTKLLEEFGYTHTDDYDKVLMNFVRTSILDEDALRAEYEQYVEKVDFRNLYERWQEPWKKLYHGTLADNETEFGDQIVSTTRDFIARMGLNQIDEALHMLEKLDRVDDAEELLGKYLEVRGHEIPLVFRESMMEPLKFRKLADAVEKANREDKVDRRPLDETIADALGDQFIHDAERRRLAEFSVDDYVDYLTSSDRPHLTGILRHLRDHTSASGDAASRKVHKTVLEVAKVIASKSRLNRLRMESMGFTDLDVSEEQT